MVDEPLHGELREAVGEEEAAGLDGGAEQGGTHATVQAGDAASTERLAEAVEGAGVAERYRGGLRLEPDFDRVEGVLDDLAYDPGDLSRRLVE